MKLSSACGLIAAAILLVWCASLVQGAEVTIFATADATISSMFGGSNNNSGSDTTLGIAGVTNYGGDADSMIRFDFSAVPTGASITAAKLRWNRAGNLTDTDANTGIEAVFTAAPQSPSWSESLVTWNNAPARGTALFNLPISIDSRDGRTIEFTSAGLLNWVTSARANQAVGDAGWRVYGISDGNKGVSMYSRENTFPFFGPRLVITHDGAAVSDRLKLANFTVCKTGTPLIEEGNGTIGISCTSGQAADIYYPTSISGDFTATCRFSAFMPKVWISTPQAMVGVFLRPSSPGTSIYPNANKIIYSNLSAAWADSDNYSASAKVNTITGSIGTVFLQQKKEYEFYFRIVKRIRTFTVLFSRNGYNWTKVAESSITGSYLYPYFGVGVNSPDGAAGASIILKGFEVVKP